MIQPDDPRLTEFVLGELSADDQAEIQAAIESSSELQAAVEEIRQVTALLTQEYQHDSQIGLHAKQKSAIEQAIDDEPKKVRQAPQANWLLKHWAWLAVAACLVAIAVPFLNNSIGDQLAMKPNSAAATADRDSSTNSQDETHSQGATSEPSNSYELSDTDETQPVDYWGGNESGQHSGNSSDDYVGEQAGERSSQTPEDVLGLTNHPTASPIDEADRSVLPETELHTLDAEDRPHEDSPVWVEPIAVAPSASSPSEVDHKSKVYPTADMVMPIHPFQPQKESQSPGEMQSPTDQFRSATGGVTDEFFLTPRIIIGDEEEERASLSKLLVMPGGSANAEPSKDQALKMLVTTEPTKVESVQESKDFAADAITERIASDLAQATPAKKPTRNKTRSWKRVQAIPNTSRLMIGDHEELDMNGMQVHVRVDGFRARVLVDCFYYNDRNQQLEGKFKLRLPDDASLYYFAFGQSAFDLTSNGDLTRDEFVDPSTSTRLVALKPSHIKRVRGDVWRNVKESRMVPREKAAYAYSQTVRRQVDPALVEWSGAGIFNASVFPLMPKKLHRIVIGYDVDLQRTEDGLAYNLDLPNSIKQCKVDIDVRQLNGATIELDTRAKFSESSNQGIKNFQIDEPRGDESQPIRLTIRGGQNTALVSRNKQDGHFFATRAVLDLPTEDAAGSERALFLVDTSLSSRPDKFNVWLQLLEATLSNNRDSLKEFAVAFFDVESRFWKAEYVKNTEANAKVLLDSCQNVVLEGATDLHSAVRLISDATWVTDGDAPDVFLLSDGAVNWGETNLRLIQREFQNAQLGSLFAYQTGMTGSSIANLRFLTSETGGAVFSVASEQEVTKASTAHRARPWQLESIELEGADDILTAGRVQWVYPNQTITVVGRLQEDAELADLKFQLVRGSEKRTLAFRPSELIKSDMAGRVYGQVAVGQLESLDQAELDVTTAYARHFRITGDTCSLLMLESEADYQRFNIKPEEDLFVVKTTNAANIIQRTLSQHSEELGDPKAQLLAWILRLEKMPGINFKLPTALRLALDRIDVEAIHDDLQVTAPVPAGVPLEYQKHLAAEQLNYDTVIAEAERRGRNSSARAVKVLSSLIERHPGDLTLARDVAFTSMEMSRPTQAYHLLRKVAKARPYDPSVYTALGQCLTQLNKADMAIVFYEIAIRGEFQNRSQDFRKIAGTEYAFLLRQIASDQRDSKIKTYAKARLQTIADKYKIETDADLLITMMWNTDQSDVDLHVVEPSGEECFYSHPKTRSGGHITRDITDGFGPEMYAINKAPAGNYNVWVKYFNTNRNRAGMRSKVYLTIYRDFGSGSETVTRQAVKITKPGQKEQVETVVLKGEDKQKYPLLQ